MTLLGAKGLVEGKEKGGKAVPKELRLDLEEEMVKDRIRCALFRGGNWN